jgi:hypothetical protein
MVAPLSVTPPLPVGSVPVVGATVSVPVPVPVPGAVVCPSVCEPLKFV